MEKREIGKDCLEGVVCMEIGFAQQCITPALPAGLAGFSKKRIAELVRDDLYVKAVVFQKGGKWYGALA